MPVGAEMVLNEIHRFLRRFRPKTDNRIGTRLPSLQMNVKSDGYR